MSNTDKQEPTEDQGQPDLPVNRYEVVPYSKKIDENELYSFRAGISLPERDPAAPTAQLAKSRNTKLMTAAFGGAILLLVLILVVISLKRGQPLPFIDMGTSSVNAAGLGGRLIAKWDGKAEYEMHIDPLLPQQIAGFSAVAGDPPYPLSVNIRLKNSSGSVVCQKEILFPFNQVPFSQAADSDPDHLQALLPQKTLDGDTVQNVAGSDGQIAEIVINGGLPCSAKQYKAFASWDFSSSFPALADQQDWIKHQQTQAENARRRTARTRAKAPPPHVQFLPAPIEGDDVIVSDNPSKGSVETRAGRVFFIGKDELRGGIPGWQVFPAAIHFRCDTKAVCVLTRSDASAASLQARLMR